MGDPVERSRLSRARFTRPTGASSMGTPSTLLRSRYIRQLFLGAHGKSPRSAWAWALEATRTARTVRRRDSAKRLLRKMWPSGPIQGRVLSTAAFGWRFVFGFDSFRGRSISPDTPPGPLQSPKDSKSSMALERRLGVVYMAGTHNTLASTVRLSLKRKRSLSVSNRDPAHPCGVCMLLVSLTVPHPGPEGRRPYSTRGKRVCMDLAYTLIERRERDGYEGDGQNTLAPMESTHSLPPSYTTETQYYLP